ncbi:hypothetical protein C1J05_12225 [Sulfitobacter sp. JL08]|nr:hypothetical protein C1J05_12225 [Sulfitobacter sp. JL08]
MRQTSQQAFGIGLQKRRDQVAWACARTNVIASLNRIQPESEQVLESILRSKFANLLDFGDWIDPPTTNVLDAGPSCGKVCAGAQLRDIRQVTG